ncbi:MAG TPA: glycosyltransferase [Micromonosporaceae bacterium]|jgi:glycosyltransferase involved in cell wall biosynthesis
MTPRTITVVTAVHGPSMKYLPEAYASLDAQVLPDGWAWQWLVQEDGVSGAARDHLPEDARISLGTGRPLGQGIARTYALARATGDYIKVLDSDDLLTPGALARDIDVLERHPEVGWTTCSVLDLMPDGQKRGFDGNPPDGVMDRGAVHDYWLSHGYRASVHPATLCIRRTLLLALGGWMALPAGEDTGLMLAADAVSNGYFIDRPGLLYRKWPGQVTADPAHTAAEEFAARNAVIHERAAALFAATPPIHMP